MQSFILPANGQATPKSIERKRKMAEAMLAQGVDYSPIASPWQGAARMANALVGGLGQRKADKQEAEGMASAREAMIKALNGGDNAAVADAVTNPFADNNSMSFLKDRYAQLNPDVNGGSEYGLQPIITQDENGKYHLYQAAKDGSAPREIELPHNWTPKMQFLNTETGFAPVATQGVLQPGQGPGNIPINNTQAAADTVVGKDQGTAAALHASLSSKLPGLQKVVNDLEVLADQATYTRAGQARDFAMKELSMEPTESAVARSKYIAMVDNQVLPMLRDTFGAQFTVVEGETLRKTLGDPNKSPKEKKAVLNAFIQQKVRDIHASGVQGGVIDPTQPQALPQPLAIPDVSTMSDEDLQAIINGP